MAVVGVAAPASVGTRIAVVLLVGTAVGSLAVIAGETSLGSSLLLGAPSPPLFVLLAVVVSVGAAAGAIAGAQARAHACVGLALASGAASVTLWGASRWTAQPWAVWCLCAAPLVVPGIVLCAQAWGSTSLVRDRARTSAAMLSVSAVLLLLLAYDPYRDVWCLSPCRESDAPLAGMLNPATAYAASSLLVACAATVGILCLLRSRVPIPILLQRVSVAALAAVAAASLLVAQAPDAPAWRVAQQWAGPVSVVLVGAAAVLVGLRAQRVRQRLAVVTALEEEPAHTVGGGPPPEVRLQFPLPGSGQWVERDGSPAADVEGSFVIVLDEQSVPVVRIVGKPGVDLDDAVQALGPFERMALESARESALTQAHARQVTESQRRIVALTDRERRRIEADLHDGAQQRLVSVKLHLALAAARRADSARALSVAEHDVQQALSALRDIAHGQLPRFLETEGLALALEELTASANVAVSLVGALPEEDPPADVAVAVYATVASVLDQADSECTEPIIVGVHRRSPWLVLEMSLPWVLQRTPDVVVAADRIGALGGTLVSNVGDGRTDMRGRVPCE